MTRRPTITVATDLWKAHEQLEAFLASRPAETEAGSIENGARTLVTSRPMQGMSWLE